MSLVEVMGQCQKCKDLISIELRPRETRKGAQVQLRGQYYSVGAGRTYEVYQGKLRHKAIVVPCLGEIHLRGGMTPLTVQHDDEPSIYPQFHTA